MITIVPLVPPRSSIDAKDAMKALLDQLAYKPSKPKVFIKPNIVDALGAGDAVDVDPAVIGGLVLALKERGAEEFVIGEGSAYFSNDEKNWKRLLEESGYEAMVKELDEKHGIKTTIVNLETASREEYAWKYGVLKLPSLCKTHAYINVAKMKTHLHTMVTLVTKNQKGLLLLADKKAFHLSKKYGNLHENIKELGSIMKPELAIIDATRALEGSGPTQDPISTMFAPGQTKVRRLKICIGGMDMTEVDNAACQIMGIPVDEVKHLAKVKISVAKGSQPLIPASPPFARPKIEIQMTEKFYRHVFEEACTGCQMGMSRMLRKIMALPELRERFLKFQTRHGRIDLILGNVQKEKVDEIAKKGGKLVFFGNCTKKLSELFSGSIHVPGCSPDHNDAIHILLDLNA